jgi:hypothetical protein
MNIDFLKNKDGDFGLVSTGQFPSIITGIIFDHKDMTLSLEFDETVESLTLNIAVDAAYLLDLTQKSQLFIIGTDKTHVHEAYSAPLLHINDIQDNDVGEWR